MLKFSGQLMILQNGQSSRGLQLLIVHGQQVSLGLLDVEEHLFAKLLRLLDPLQFFLLDLVQPERLLISKLTLESLNLFLHLPLQVHEG